MDIEEAIAKLIDQCGDDSTREGVAKTPARVVKAFSELTAGYQDDPAVHLATTFDVQTAPDTLIVVSELPFVSLCEHHLLPFTGTASIGYLPDPAEGRVVGLSKLGRLLDCYAKRFQVQERLTVQIGEALDEHLKPLGAGVLIKASHSCMALRGVQKPGVMTTSYLSGAFRDNTDLRNEFLHLAGLK